MIVDMLFDSHAHLDDEQFEDDRDEIIAGLVAKGVGGIINPAADMLSSLRAMTLADKYPFMYAAVGIHPHDAKAATSTDYDQLAQWAGNKKVVAIGEIGLDYYYDLSPRDVQQSVLTRQLDLARQVHLPIIIHNRDAHGDIMRILKKEAQGLTGVFHCYSGSIEMAKELLGMGFYISFGGPITFKNAVKAKEVARILPLDRVLIETDSPYLTPHPYRGKRNDPSYVQLVAEELARLRELEVSEIARITTQNVQSLFNIK